ncbi:MAG TPA: phosphate-starvation-inducible PsiE family protein [Coleofasciculaceae cyanobacterium]
MQRFLQYLRKAFSDDYFLHHLEQIEGLVSKVLSVAMVLVILAAVYDLSIYLIKDFILPEISRPTFGQFTNGLFNVFGLFLNVLIALEILENITAYLKKHVIQVELVIVTSLIAVARKIIILDLERKGPLDLIALAAAIFALASSYWIIKRVNRQGEP